MLLQGTAGNDRITGYATADTINGNDGDDTVDGAAGDDVIHGGMGGDGLTGGDGHDTLDGGAGNDVLFGGNGNDVLTGGDGNDQLYATSYYPGGNAGAVDVLDGGAGNDHLGGGFGSQTYLFGRGDGQDTLNNDNGSGYLNPDNTANKLDVLQFKAGVAPSDISLNRSHLDLILRINGTADQVRVQNYFVNDGIDTRHWALDAIRFHDGTSWSIADVKSLLLQGTTGSDHIIGYATADTINGNDGVDTIDGAAGDDLIDGGLGDDQLTGGDGNDTMNGGADASVDVLFGGNGNDVLTGGDGNDQLYAAGYYGGGNVGAVDLLDGGAGNDKLVGGRGSQTYLFGRGDGQDTLNNDVDSWNGGSDATSGKLDVLQFKAGVASTDLSLSSSGNNLIVRIVGTTDQVTVLNHFLNGGSDPRGWAIDAIRFDDGTTWSAADIKTRMLQGSPGNDTIMGVGINDVIDGGDGNDTLTAGGNNTTLIGGAGDDTLNGNSRTYITHIGGTGNDTLNGSYYADTYRYNRGDGADLISDYGQLSSATNFLDRVLFGTGITASELSARRVGNNLVLDIAGSAGDQITFQHWFTEAAGNWRIEQLLFADGSVMGHSELAQLALTTTNTGTEGNDTLAGTAHYTELIMGGAGNDTLTGVGANDVLDGGDGSDTLRAGGNANTLMGGAGNDVLDANYTHTELIGGAGNDTLNGSYYADTYRYNRGDGADVISDYGQLTSAVNFLDRVHFGAGITASDLSARRVGNNLVLDIAGSAGDQITFQHWFTEAAGNWRIEQLLFADGSVMGHSELAQLALTTTNTGTEGDDTLTGTAHYTEHLLGGGGDDTITAVGLADTLEGGAGNDTLNGSHQANTYRFNHGDGSDVITDSGTHSTSNSTYIDRIQFGEDILEEDVWLSRSGNHLLIDLMDDGGQMRVSNWYSSPSNRIEEFHLADGQRLLAAQVDLLVQAMASFAPPAMGQTTLTPEQQASLAPVIAANWN
jgi:Ca2+-binding RTX toxin-like protein